MASEKTFRSTSQVSDSELGKDEEEKKTEYSVINASSNNDPELSVSSASSSEVPSDVLLHTPVHTNMPGHSNLSEPSIVHANMLGHPHLSETGHTNNSQTTIRKAVSAEYCAQASVVQPTLDDERREDTEAEERHKPSLMNPETVEDHQEELEGNILPGEEHPPIDNTRLVNAPNLPVVNTLQPVDNPALPPPTNTEYAFLFWIVCPVFIIPLVLLKFFLNFFRGQNPPSEEEQPEETSPPIRHPGRCRDDADTSSSEEDDSSSDKEMQLVLQNSSNESDDDVPKTRVNPKGDDVDSSDSSDEDSDDDEDNDKGTPKVIVYNKEQFGAPISSEMEHVTDLHGHVDVILQHLFEPELRPQIQPFNDLQGNVDVIPQNLNKISLSRELLPFNSQYDPSIDFKLDVIHLESGNCSVAEGKIDSGQNHEFSA